ncbi:MAG: DoxX family protein [Sulfurimonas sp.]|uniref:DoxX family protein n=1 Tax=Sulfurimonas sp. TaxID=2022749 RepID=UPI002634011C|nr:DoxX family protein [Sulfurimonas sp.]MDD2651804.1 DoxX family protein [Sulfurimonas sp.]MDD3451644.1 DoxX family protein [Sulfurimonas sp.]
MQDITKLFLRLAVGIMMLFHGLHKIIHGIGGVRELTLAAGLPEFVAYGVYVGEVVVPIFILLGAYARAASLILALNMAMVIFLAYGNSLFALGKHGAPVFELPFLYLILSLMIFVFGSGKYALNGK